MAETSSHRNMRIGDQFHLHGYGLLATAQYGDLCGEVVVLNNNSTHYLVAVRQGDGDEMATLKGSFDYLDRPAAHAYRDALTMLARIASTHGM